jgi:hypothetical protein
VDNALPASKKLANQLLNEEQTQVVEKTLKEIEEKPHSYNIEIFWKLDASIGGIGGYCMPFDPTRNPFPAGIGRSLFRPLQYARSEIEVGKNIYNTARYVVQYSGMHLESAIKFLIEKRLSRFNIARHEKITLGQGIQLVKEKKILSQSTIQALKLLLSMYNLSKHEVNQNEERERLFSPADALISYISSRILGKEILKPYYPEILKNIEQYLNRLKGLNMNL